MFAGTKQTFKEVCGLLLNILLVPEKLEGTPALSQWFQLHGSCRAAMWMASKSIVIT